MANYTEKAMIQTFEHMLEEMPFEKITVSALVVRCEISANTFYYHFHDIYDLLDKWLTALKEQFFRDTEDMTSWSEQMKAVLHAMQARPKLVFHLFDSLPRERLERFVFVSVENLFYEAVSRHASGLNVPDETVKYLAGFCCYSLLGFLLKFIWERMEPDVDEAVDRLSAIFFGAVEYIIRKAPADGSASAPV